MQLLRNSTLKRIRVQSYGNGKSKSARELAKYLRVLRIKASTGSRFRGRNSDVIVNWGKPKNILENVRYLNSIEAVIKASNKLVSLETMGNVGISIPKVYKELISPPTDVLLMARTTLYGHSGNGIVVGTRQELYNNGIEAQLYTEYIAKVAEYRVIVVGNEAVDVKVKKKKRDYEGDRGENYIWNASNGYVFARNIGVFNVDVCVLGVSAVKALGLMYGAVDIIEDEAGKLYVLEVNTAFGLEGTTTSLVGDAIKKILETL